MTLTLTMPFYSSFTQGIIFEKKRGNKRLNEKCFKKTSRVSAKQIAGHKRQSENIKDCKSLMIGHIIKKISDGLYSPDDFLDDPTVYFDPAILGKYTNNLIVRKSIVKAIEKEYGRTIPF